MIGGIPGGKSPSYTANGRGPKPGRFRARRSTMNRVFIFALAVMGLVGSAANSARVSPRLVIGGDGPASRDGAYFHVEISAASALDSRKLLTAAITGSRQDVGSVCKVYSSPDGGATWKDWETAEQRG